VITPLFFLSLGFLFYEFSLPSRLLTLGFPLLALLSSLRVELGKDGFYPFLFLIFLLRVGKTATPPGKVEKLPGHEGSLIFPPLGLEGRLKFSSFEL